jgi:hypothetical protein
MKFKHDPVYSDVEHLIRHGIWPEGRVPDWAEERGEDWGCGPAHCAVLQEAMQFEIARLRKGLAAWLVEVPGEEELGRIMRVERLEMETMALLGMKVGHG